MSSFVCLGIPCSPFHIALDEPCAYPTCRFDNTWWRSSILMLRPQGLMFKIGIFMGWSELSIDGTVPWETLVPVYIGACLWTLTYETVYQHQVRLFLYSLTVLPEPYHHLPVFRTRWMTSKSAYIHLLFCSRITPFPSVPWRLLVSLVYWLMEAGWMDRELCSTSASQQQPLCCYRLYGTQTSIIRNTARISSCGHPISARWSSQGWSSMEFPIESPTV